MSRSGRAPGGLGLAAGLRGAGRGPMRLSGKPGGRTGTFRKGTAPGGFPGFSKRRGR